MKRHKLIVKSLLFLLACVVLGLVLNKIPELLHFNETWIDTQVRDFGLTGLSYFFLLCTVSMAFGLPRQLFAFLGGYAFGFSVGMVVTMLAATLGCCLCFYCARLVGQYQHYGKYQAHVEKINIFLKSDPLTKTMVIRLFPVGSNLLTNIVAGFSQIQAGRFILGSCLGYIPQMAVFALLGSGVTLMSYWKIALSIILFSLSMLLSFHLYQKYQFETSSRQPS